MVFSDRYFVTPTPVSLPAVVDAWFPSAPSSRLLFKLKAPRGASTPLGTIEAYDPATLTGSAFVDIAVAQEFSNTPTGLLCECIAGVDCTTDCAGTPFQPGAVGEVYVKQNGTDRVYLYKRESALFDASGPFSLECEGRNLSIPYGDVYTWTGSLDGYDDLVFFSDLADPREAGLPYLCGGPVVENLDAHLCGPLDNETGRLWPRVIAPSILFSLTHDVVDQVQCFADDHLQTTLPFSDCNGIVNNGLVLPATLPLVALEINDTDFTNSLEVNGQDVDVAFGAASRRRRLQELYANIINVYYVLSPMAEPPPPPPAEAPPSSDMQTIITAVASSVGALVLLGIV
ncbi:MAG: hypothetical protein VYC04_00440, partial [Actinomycetota bacterium]|nr:hypothetical protein [Actinomycetota bacterium]